MIVKAKIRSDWVNGEYKTPIYEDCYNGQKLFLLKPGDEIEYDDEEPLVEHRYIVHERDEHNIRHNIEHVNHMVKAKYYDIVGLVAPWVIEGYYDDVEPYDIMMKKLTGPLDSSCYHSDGTLSLF